MSRPVPDPIQWHEGLLLSPQHFQQLSLRLETLIQALPARYFPFYWGIRAFDYEPTDFTIGVLTVRALDAVMPDGFHVVSIPEQDRLQIDLRPYASTMRQRPMHVYLAMPISDGHTPAATQRFFSYEGEAVADENTGDGAVSIPRLRPRLSLIAGTEPPAGRYTSFPLIEVRCEGETFLPTEFVPPTLVVAGASPIGRKCSDISEHLRRKAVQMAERAILTPQSPFAAHARTQLRALVSSLPALEALLRTDLAHPFTLYLALCGLAGEVSLLGNSLLPPVFPPFIHNDPRKSIDEVTRFILRSVDEGVPDTVRRFSFEPEDEAFRLGPDPAWSTAFQIGSPSRAVLALRADARPEQVIEWGENCVIGSRNAIPSLLSRRILGVERRYAERVGELLPPHGVYLFELTPGSGDVRMLDDLLVIGSTSSIRPESVSLYVLDPDVATESV